MKLTENKEIFGTLQFRYVEIYFFFSYNFLKLIIDRVPGKALAACRDEIVIFDTSARSGRCPDGCSLSPERSEGDKNTRAIIALFAHVYRTLFF